MIKIFTEDELYEFVYENNYDKFKVNVDSLKDRIKYFDFDNGFWRDNIYVIKIINSKIVGILCYSICKNEPTFEGNMHFLSYISVDPEFQNQGISKELIENWIPIIRTDLGICGCSGFTEKGYNFLRKSLLEIGVECEDKISF